MQVDVSQNVCTFHIFGSQNQILKLNVATEKLVAMDCFAVSLTQFWYQLILWCNVMYLCKLTAVEVQSFDGKFFIAVACIALLMR